MAKKNDNWGEAEMKAVEFLNDTYGDLAVFTGTGGTDSTHSDIAVDFGYGVEFYIEVKLMPPKASGQFTLSDTGECFVVSDRSKDEKTIVQDLIVSMLNNHYAEIHNDCKKKSFELEQAHMKDIQDNEAFAPVTGDFSGELSQLVLEGIRQHYTNKGARYMMVCDSSISQFDIFPIDDVFYYLEGGATLFVDKPYGNHEIRQKYSEDVMDALERELGLDREYMAFGKVIDDKNRLIAWFSEPFDEYHFGLDVFPGNDCKWTFRGYDSDSDGYMYEVRKYDGGASITVEYNINAINGELAGDANEFERELGCNEGRWYRNLLW